MDEDHPIQRADGYRPMGDEGGEGDDEDTMAEIPF
jgi:hypothetical protein